MFKRLLVVLVVLAVLAAAGGLWVYRWFEESLRPVAEAPGGLVEFRVRPGQGTADIADELEEAGLIRSALAFRILARREGTDGLMKAGLYQLPGDLDARSLMDILLRGQVTSFSVTIPEGFTVRAITDRVVESGIVDADEWERALDWARSADGPLAGILPRDDRIVEPLEGYLFPDTYRLTENTSARRFVEMMIDRFLEVYDSLATERGEPALAVHQVVTLASIVEREAVVADERATIGGVFHNRLRIGMKLDSCATVAYVIGREPLLRDLEIAHPYNTYVNNGLPPGPIASPGRAALSAAMDPNDVPYFYFVARGDGSHAFSVTYGEHLRNVARYQSGP